MKFRLTVCPKGSEIVGKAFSPCNVSEGRVWTIVAFTGSARKGMSRNGEAFNIGMPKA